MAVSTTQLRKLQAQVKSLRAENLRLKRLLRGNGGRRKSIVRKTASHRKRIVKLGGLWADTPEITDQDIREARQAIWKNFGKRAL
jgi:hypothetical protein